MKWITAPALWMGLGSVATLMAVTLLTRTPSMAEGVDAPSVAETTRAPALPVAGVGQARAGGRAVCACPGDFNGDTLINSADLVAFLGVFGTVCCDDGDPCTIDTNVGGVCTYTPVSCNDNNPCTNDICNPATGCTYVSNTSPCDDGNPCTGHDRCINGVCVGSPLICDDNNPCTDDFCDPDTGQCIHISNCPDDGNLCTVESCDPNTFNCVQTVRDCNDNNPCTVDSCQASIGCVYASLPNNSRCDDGSVCTTNDLCINGNCVGTPVICPPDNNPCTTDICNPATGCAYVNNTNACDDGNPCTINDTCVNGVCKGTPLPCDDGNPCTLDSCVNGSCVNTVLPNNSPCDDGNPCTINDRCINGICTGDPNPCDDGSPCTIDACINGLCVNTPVPDGTLCQAPNVCFVNGVCINGACTGGTPVTCPTSNPCITGFCNPSTGCVFVPSTNICDDGNPCTINDKCENGVCQGTPIVCPPGQVCNSVTGGCMIP